MSCDSGLTEIVDTESYANEIIGYTTLGFTAYRWEHSIDWEYSYCTDTCSNCVAPYEDSTVDSGDTDVRNKFTDIAVSYLGIVGKDEDLEESTYTSYRQAKYESAVFSPLGNTLKVYPTSELQGDDFGNGTTLTSRK